MFWHEYSNTIPLSFNSNINKKYIWMKLCFWNCHHVYELMIIKSFHSSTSLTLIICTWQGLERFQVFIRHKVKVSNFRTRISLPRVKNKRKMFRKAKIIILINLLLISQIQVSRLINSRFFFWVFEWIYFTRSFSV